MLTQANTDSQVQELRQRLRTLILEWETVPGGMKNSRRARMVYVTRKLKALRQAVQS